MIVNYDPKPFIVQATGLYIISELQWQTHILLCYWINYSRKKFESSCVLYYKSFTIVI